MCQGRDWALRYVGIPRTYRATEQKLGVPKHIIRGEKLGVLKHIMINPGVGDKLDVLR